MASCVLFPILFSGSLRLPGPEELGAGSSHGGSQGDDTQDTLREVQVRSASVIYLSHTLKCDTCLVRFDKLREMMGGPRDYRVSQQ